MDQVVSMDSASPVIDPARHRAVIHGLDDVLTSTARVHAACWKQACDEALSAWDHAQGTTTPRFTVPEDYDRWFRDRPPAAAVRSFLRSRDVELTEGTGQDRPADWTVQGVLRRKQQLVGHWLSARGIDAFPGSVAWLRELRKARIATGVVTQSRHCDRILRAAGIRDLIDVQVDGTIAAERDLAGVPAPDLLVEAARRLEVRPDTVVAIVSSPDGAAAAAAGGFGYVIGVDRHDARPALLAAGADLVVADLAELVPEATARHHPAGPRLHRIQAATQRLLSAEGDFPIDPFRIVERRFDPDYLPQLETVFSLSNGYLGLRGSHPEGRPSWAPGVFLNGFYETWPIVYPEAAYGFAKTGQTMVPVPDGTIVRLYVDDARVDLGRVDIVDYERVLDMTTGSVERRLAWAAPDGARFSLRTRTLVSLGRRHLAAIDWELVALDRPAEIVLASEIARHPPPVLDEHDPRQAPQLVGSLQPRGRSASHARASLCLETRNSGRRVACGMQNVLSVGEGPPLEPSEEALDDDHAAVHFRCDAPVGVPVHLTKYLAYHHGADTVDELAFRVEQTLDRATADGLAVLEREHQKVLDDFWRRSDVITDGAPLLQQAVRFNVFQLLQATARVEGFGVPPKGLTGLGYEGHYFWDTEIYVMPFLVYTSPRLARGLLRNRYAMLDAARLRARELGHAGALFPWRTIMGEEASAFYAAGTAQYHIDADVAYALDQYVRATGDLAFLAREGAEILVETARLWADLGFFSERRGGRFVINGVTGPDEYSAVVDNNTFTNLMARHNLRLAATTIDWLRRERPADFARLRTQTELAPDEPAQWQRAAEQMYLPYDEREQVHRQDDAFLDRERWDFEGTPVDHYPLLLHYHPLVLYRHQVIKQTDVVLATFLLGNEFTDQEKRRIFEYYDPLTTGDSSLSECIQAIMAAEIGDDLRAAEEYLIDAATIDLTDSAGNVRDGVHVASAGGTWMALVNGFGGMRHYGDRLSFRPRLPERLSGLSFRVRVGEALLLVDVERSSVSYRLLEGASLVIDHAGEELTVTDAATTRPLPRR
jgi:alpha,alpha-trehalose phosphorylase